MLESHQEGGSRLGRQETHVCVASGLLPAHMTPPPPAAHGAARLLQAEPGPPAGVRAGVGAALGRVLGTAVLGLPVGHLPQLHALQEPLSLSEPAGSWPAGPPCAQAGRCALPSQGTGPGAMVLGLRQSDCLRSHCPLPQALTETVPKGWGLWVHLGHSSHLLCSSIQASCLHKSQHPRWPQGALPLRNADERGPG